MPVARMNFLRHVGRGFTYRNMLYAMTSWLVLMIVISGVQFLRAYYTGRDIERSNAEIAQLNAEKERQIDLIKSMGTRRINVAAKENINSIISLRPRWSNILRALVRSLPADVWLDGVTVAGGGEEWYTLQIKGKAKSQRVLTTFILQLGGDGYFNKTSLEGARQNEEKSGVIDFDLSTQPDMKKLMEDD